MKTAILTVIYPGIENYLPKFLDSLEGQDDQEFTLLLVNDGLSNVENFLDQSPLQIKTVNSSGTPSKLRKEAIEWALSLDIENIIFADSDDYFPENRVSVSKKLLETHDIVCNELMLVGDDYSTPTPLFSSILEDNAKITKETLLEGNCMGLTNTAINSRAIPNIFKEIPDDIIAFDWMLFSMAINSGASAIFTNKTSSYYRQYDKNIAAPGNISDKQILRGVKIKKGHFNFLAPHFPEYQRIAREYEELFLQINQDNVASGQYCQRVREHFKQPALWWQPMQIFK